MMIPTCFAVETPYYGYMERSNLYNHHRTDLNTAPTHVIGITEATSVPHCGQKTTAYPYA